MVRFILILVLLAYGSVACAQDATSATPDAENTSMIVYLGTSTGGKSATSKGIYRARLDMNSGALSAPELVAETNSPGFLAIHPNRRFLYAANESVLVSGERIGAASSFKIDPATGDLQLINSQAAHGKGPCHITIDSTGQAALVANYSSGNVVALPIKPDGSLGEVSANVQHAGSSANPRRQEGPHAHSIYPDPTNRFALSCDLGTDQVLVYRLDPQQATITPNDPPFATVAAGSGPRHLAFHPSGKFAYVLTELLNTVIAFEWDPRRGVLSEIQTISTLPDGYAEKTYGSEIAVHPNGRFVYTANRGHDSLAVFAVDESTGKLTSRGQTPIGGTFPRHFAIDPTGKFLIAANQHSNDLTIFRIDAMSGSLTPINSPIPLGTPMCVRFMPPAVE